MAVTLNPGFLTAEDAALKRLLSGMTVSDRANSTRNVNVHFRWPDEKQTIEYPMLTIDMLDITMATERVESFDYINPPYIPSTAPDAAAAHEPPVSPGQELRSVRYIPVDIFYQVTTHCYSFGHDRQILAQMWSMDRLPPRYGYLDIPEDNTTRRLDVLEYRPANVLDPRNRGKRMFRQYYTVRINGELSVATLQTVSLVQTVNLTVLSQLNQFTITE